MLQIKNIDDRSYNDAYSFLSSVPSINEVEGSILRNGAIVIDEGKVIASVSFENYDCNGLIRYFVFKKSLPNNVLIELMNKLEENARREGLISLICVADNIQIENLFKELGFNIINSRIFVNEERVLNTSFKDSSFLEKFI